MASGDGDTVALLTAWGSALDPDAVLQEYPRPQLVRDSYLNLNGYWQYAVTPAAAQQPPDTWEGQILVPFSPEAPLSGVGRQLQPDQALWYRRTVRLPEGFAGERVLLHFGAVDQSCTVTVNGIPVGGHVGGYLPFTLDVTDALVPEGESGQSGQEIVVRVRDVSDTGHHSRGKQKLDRGGIWYTAQSGIWQTVWLESVPRISVGRLALVPDLESVDIKVLLDGGAGPCAGEGGSVDVSEGRGPDLTALVTLSAGGRTVAEAAVVPGVPSRIRVPDPHLWTPDDPFLYDVEVRLLDGGREVDRVQSYTGLRTVGMGPDAKGRQRLLLNDRPYFHAGLLDQGYWPDGLYTAPSDAALASDIRRAKDLGFTMLRKHIKIEPLRWYYHCDRLGILVWQDLVNGGSTYRNSVIRPPAAGAPHRSDDAYLVFGRDDEQGRQEFLAELRGTVELLQNAVSLAVWVPFNEGWGQFDANAAAHLLRRLDPTRTIDHASGWHDQGGGDLKSVHVYVVPFRLRKGWLRGGRAVVLSEYGGYSLRIPGHTFNAKEHGYRSFRSRAALKRAYRRLMLRQIEPAVARGLAATVYTQLTDVEDEDNGLLTYDRAVLKIDAGTVRELNARLIRAACS
ncbi:glycoside hydrolase family 2 [Arthrobacter sp. zg-Y20]|uniref:glycoside hydrolase family 2 protein n=1 Tax=unclassified Arthrobacter TaxID=235627 RepID=UPI001D132E45|nr:MULTISPECIES: sugar-binding domain-containing protein [unclassified Arthrobacter]MCC3277005.1 glycoside hydrolase family 2 [Arthrobacter sp. zg-Y20]MDK1317166.1 glycoside hydrolase family 2 [Arthrobacter sp. zg.Y20]WIB07264.1 glycoside hydrolase family 2 [Arthrobacter sp. zg-Y20]